MTVRPSGTLAERWKGLRVKGREGVGGWVGWVVGWGGGAAVKEALNRHMFIIALRYAPTPKTTKIPTNQTEPIKQIKSRKDSGPVC